ncbi:hypothetical protein PSN45_002106 [Yamadazyma tenuis]|uniref:triacylglycerol lipase n=1 Tax=Candida tenuis (strain ATCC 10573 / BCRC 21748 / CBS 615 / JCM 9827 / NBRC 10315 / NRRL Y-1498 / VKM Y-70) TaxID=590646 RepID=G3BC95_CANTC|nr:triacylglycerol lipase precursor [Yamadazyma tenuis ATCC 10573]EGV60147.1 triacylglycerol lipase precursor [Yamadazyma tenuis ATCC 10573]WEJ94615.1 hypothetical protein PSN45_002106 [Yamadazyma tenuis]
MISSFLLLVIFLITGGLGATEYKNTVDSYPSDYKSLVEYANIASFAYCVKHGLQPGPLGKKSSQCPIARCQLDEYKGLQVISTFNFNEMGDVGAGLYAIDIRSKRIILVYRGTSSRRDGLANIDIFPMKYEPLINLVNGYEKVGCDGCRVHRGFYNFLKKDAYSIVTEVNQLWKQHKDYQLVVVGHSLGATLALLSGIELQLMGLNPLVITYASPKIGNKEMMMFVDTLFESEKVAAMSLEHKELHHGYIRVVHEGDIVPSLPPTSVYRHGGVKYVINKPELPHSPENILREGMSSYAWDVSNMDYSKPAILQNLNPIFQEKEAHSSYFVKITGCT